jgi:hypothetical protein
MTAAATLSSRLRSFTPCVLRPAARIDLVSMRMICRDRGCESLSTVLLQFGGDVLNRGSAQPLVAILGVVAGAGAVDAEEAREAVYTHFAMKDIEGVFFELLVRHLFKGNHRRTSCNQSKPADKKAYPRGDPKLKHWATSPGVVTAPRCLG